MTRYHVFWLFLAATGCGEVKSMVDALVVDTVPLDAAIADASDARPDTPDAPPDAAVVPRRKVHASTSGGGTVASAGHRIRVRIGAPQPAGSTASANHRVFTGPGAMP